MRNPLLSLLLLTVAACGGAAPADSDSAPTLIDTADEPPGAECAEGGVAIRTGLDDDGDGVLGDVEVDHTAYVCASSGAPNVLVRIDDEAPGANCQLGGSAVHTGVDDDDDGVLDDPEIDTTSYICGYDGVGEIVAGNVTVRNTIDIALLEGVTTITGDLTLAEIDADDLDTLELPDLEVIEGSLFIDTPVPSVSLLALESVGEDVIVRFTEGTVSLPALTLIGDGLEIRSNATVELPVLGSVQDIMLVGLERVSFDFGSLTSPMNRLIVSDCMLFPTTPSEVILGAGASSVEFSNNAIYALTSEAASIVVDVDSVDSLTMDLNAWPLMRGGVAMDAVDGLLRDVAIYDNEGLAWVSFASVDDNEQLLVTGNYGLADCHLAALPGTLSRTVTDTVPCYDIDWCRLESPTALTVPVEVDATFAGRLYVEGLTDVLSYVDEAESVRGQFGTGPDGSDPTVDLQGWTFYSALANPVWSGAEAGVDEYYSNLAFQTPGTFDTAYRFTGDGGRTWTYCDTGTGPGVNGSEDGYQTANAGSLIVTPAP